jgi:pimeloyl-ACP methyl ester carboxylesterase
LAGLRLLKSCDFVDPARVFVFAHSMGPVVGSLAFAQEPVRGLIAVETVGTSWFEYDLERLRVQAGVSGKTPEEVDREVREYEPCSHRFYIEKEKADTPTRTHLQGLSAALWSRSPLLHTSGGRHQLGQAVAERGFSGARDLPLASPVTTAHQNRYLADPINSMHPGRATYREVQEMSHDLHHWASPQEYMMNRCEANACHPFQEGLFAVMMPWLEKLV